jgi:hypothetical protein
MPPELERHNQVPHEHDGLMLVPTEDQAVHLSNPAARGSSPDDTRRLARGVRGCEARPGRRQFVTTGMEVLTVGGASLNWREMTVLPPLLVRWAEFLWTGGRRRALRHQFEEGDQFQEENNRFRIR